MEYFFLKKIKKKIKKIKGMLHLFFMWHLVQGNVLRFLGIFKDSYVWLQITPRNQIPRESGFPP